MKIGYARVSTLDQNLDLQINALESAGCEQIFQEKISGASADRPELKKLLEQVRVGDEVVVWKLDRLGRSLAHLIQMINAFEVRGVGFSSIQDRLDTSTPAGKLIFHIFCSLAEFERAQTKERTMAGLEAARLKGKIGGKPKGLSEAAKTTARVAESLYNEGFAIKLIAEKLSLSRQTVYNYLEFRGVKI